MNEFNKKEFTDLCKKFNGLPVEKEVLIKYPTDIFFKKVIKALETDRRGEVVFCVIRPNGRIIAITCNEYPEGIFRIPTGGITHDEDIVKALIRETKEELGLDVVIKAFAGVLKIRFEHGAQSAMFYSYIFILQETGGRLLEDASDDEISEVMEVDLQGLKAIVRSLKDIPGEWNNWGKFRYETSNAVLQYLEENKTILELQTT